MCDYEKGFSRHQNSNIRFYIFENLLQGKLETKKKKQKGVGHGILGSRGEGVGIAMEGKPRRIVALVQVPARDALAHLQSVSFTKYERERERASLGKEESFFTRHLNGGGNIRGKEREEDHVVKRERWDLSLNPFCIYITDCAGMEQSVVRREMGLGHVPTPHRGTK